MTIKVHVKEGRIVVNEPTDLPDGTEIEFLLLDPGDWLDKTDRAALHDALQQSETDIASGKLVSAEAILADLKSH